MGLALSHRCVCRCLITLRCQRKNTVTSILGAFFKCFFGYAWWRHQVETFSALLALCAGNSPVTGEFPAQRPVTRRFDVFFYLRLNKRLSKQSYGGWFETLSRSLWSHCNEMDYFYICTDQMNVQKGRRGLVRYHTSSTLNIVWNQIFFLFKGY